MSVTSLFRSRPLLSEAVIVTFSANSFSTSTFKAGKRTTVSMVSIISTNGRPNSKSCIRSSFCCVKGRCCHRFSKQVVERNPPPLSRRACRNQPLVFHFILKSALFYPLIQISLVLSSYPNQLRKHQTRSSRILRI